MEYLKLLTATYLNIMENDQTSHWPDFLAAGSVDLNGFSIVYQRVWERLAAIKGERVLQAW